MTDRDGGFRPRLRPEVERVGGPGGVVGLRQPATGEVAKVGRVTRALVGLLDGARPLEAVLEGAVVAGASRADAEDALRALLLLGFVEGAGDATAARLRALDREDPPVVFLEESRFTCQGSGQCCRTYELGPIDEDDVRRLDALDLASAFPELGPGPHVHRDGGGALYLERRDEHCVFLDAKGLCGIHAAFGADAKPKLCRLYPWRAQLTLQGLRIIDQSECSTFATSVRSGEPLREQLARIRPLLPARHEVHHPLALLDREHPCDYGWIVALETDLLAFLAAHRTTAFAEALLAIGRRALAFADALARCPLAPGEPDRTVEEFLARAPAVPAVPAPTAEGLSAIAEVARRLLATIDEKALTQPVIPRFREMLGAASKLAESPARAEGPAPADPALLAEVLHASFANVIFAGRLLCEGHLRAGVMRSALVALLTVVGASRGGGKRGLSRTGGSEISEAHSVATIALRMPSLQRTLVALEGSASLLLESACGVVAGKVARPSNIAGA